MPSRKIVKADAVWRPAPVTPKVIGALKGLKNGTASPEQQTYALHWICYYASMLTADTHVPGDDASSRYLSGRRSVAIQILDAISTKEERQKVTNE